MIWLRCSFALLECRECWDLGIGIDRDIVFVVHCMDSVDAFVCGHLHDLRLCVSFVFNLHTMFG